MTTSTSRSAGITLALSGLSLAVCFAAAWWSRDLVLFSLTPPGGGTADMVEALRQDLHLTFFTIWASLLLATPALALFPTIRQSARVYQTWRIFWTASLLVFAVHFYWATVVIFGNDWQRILNTPRVSAPRLDTVFALWWVVDVVLAWTTRTEAVWLRLQRLGVHLLAFVLFFMGAAREGELAASRALGWFMAVVVAAGLIAWLARRRARTTV
ncbi:hypothetical protein [Curvibacter delicatus]|jgi:hypothetical protein|uniref:hypothetical protein n=1 Tax=Curvibacter delicatus TaxID=80879 RepID=UPI00082DCF91|nr:hypothetical protein [Curvibacter delicatus]